ncbi:hypothetical protein BTUL_0151g00090 [Botrytis tulipae]|uniref:Methyltransferase domain-containing protein n=1 Tax=Botrytis tulipae TaxID=87230 RepID=A0A4Z1ELP0_9HELO|nr:hypothetical protein BTUL_0151g00090 [Botrytis tulipae]
MPTPNTISADVAPKFYDSISEKYEKYFAQDQGLLDFIRESLEVLPGDAKVLDIGCGTGIPTSLAVTNSGRTLHGIDISPKMLERSRHNVPRGTFDLVSMLDFTPREGVQYDGMFIILSMFHFTREEMGKAIARWRDWVKGEGEGYIFIGTIAAEDALRFEEGMLSDDKVAISFSPSFSPSFLAIDISSNSNTDYAITPLALRGKRPGKIHGGREYEFPVHPTGMAGCVGREWI